MNQETFLKSKVGKFILSLLIEGIDFRVTRGENPSNKFELPHYYVYYENKRNKRFIQDCFYGNNGERFTTNSRDTPFNLPLPFELDSKLPIICIKCYTKFETADYIAMCCDDDEWICAKCKGDNKEFNPPSGISI